MEQKAETNIKQLIEYSSENENGLRLRLVSTGHDLLREVVHQDVNRPGLNLFGFFDCFAYERIQVFGKGEAAYIEKLKNDGALPTLAKFFSYDMPGIVFTHGYTPPEQFTQMAQKNRIPVLVSDLGTTDFISRLAQFFTKVLAPRIVMHGVMMEIFGMGILLEGESGVGKSECALELIERGHRFIADDVVDIRCLDGRTLLASSSQVIAHHMEIQGIGIINIAHLFGVGAIRNEINVDLIVHIEHNDSKKKYDRLGLDTDYKDILNIFVPIITIPIQPGTNIPILVETATMNQRLKIVGYNPAREFNKKLSALIEDGINIY